MRALWHDMRYGIRQLHKSPGFTVVAVLSLALGIGANTAIFSPINGISYKSLPVRNPHESRGITWTGDVPQRNWRWFKGNGRLGDSQSFPYPAYLDFAEHARGFSDVSAFDWSDPLTISVGGEVSPANAQMVSGHFFKAYGVPVLIGRPIVPEDDRPDAEPVAVLTYPFWKRAYGLDPHVLGQTLTLRHTSFTVIGVLPRRHVAPLAGERQADSYVPLTTQPQLTGEDNWLSPYDNWGVQAMGIGVNTAVFSVVNAVVLKPPPYKDADRIVIPWEKNKEGLDSGVSAEGFRLLREQNSSFEYVAAHDRRRGYVTEIDRSQEMIATAASPCLFDLLGVWPLLGRTFEPDHGWRRVRGGLVVAQIGVSLMLLVGASLLIRSLVALQKVDLGCRPKNVTAMHISLPSMKYPETHQCQAFFDPLLQRVCGLRDDRAAALVCPELDWGGGGAFIDVQVEGRTPGPGSEPYAKWMAVTPEFFQAMGIEILKDRAFTERDMQIGRSSGVIIDENLARKYFPDVDPIGRKMNGASVIGVVSTIGDFDVLSSRLYNVTLTNPVTLACVSIALSVVTLLASYIPARRAAEIDPMEALRYE